MRCGIFSDFGLTVFNSPFVDAGFSIMDVTIKIGAVVGKIHDLTNGRTGAFWYNAVQHAFAFCHPRSWKTHLNLTLLRLINFTMFVCKKRRLK